ncbi:leucine rich repeat family protein [Cryptosporidium andersoni]|uniref:Leucine rich repeat family protein n=1 Tax=Cryptosporidium andersoni TaxID=117008 RepID=A0A1J4MQ75_9CRYT|nr:leucine rich repeat family protein [Cryptosporidium andersoni]
MEKVSNLILSKYIFIRARPEIEVNGRIIRQRQDVSNYGIHYRVIQDSDLEIMIVGCCRELKVSLKNDVTKVVWKFIKEGKLTIVTKKRIIVYLSNGNEYSLRIFVQYISDISSCCLFPPLTCIPCNSNIQEICEDIKVPQKIELVKQPLKKKQQLHLEIFNNIKPFKISRYEYTKQDSANVENNTIVQHDYFSNLPEDLIFKILSWLTKPICLSNDDFKVFPFTTTIFYKDQLVKSVDLLSINKKLSTFVKENIWKISLQKNCHLSDYILKRVISSYKNLGILNMTFAKLSDKEFRELYFTHNLPSMIFKLNIQGCRITDRTLRNVLLRLSNLKILDITDCFLISGITSFPIIRAVGTLEYLSCGVRKLEKTTCTINNSSLISLTGLDIETVYNEIKVAKFNQDKAINNEVIIVNSHKTNKNCSTPIKYLELLNCLLVTKISPLIAYHNTLQYLNLQGCANIEESELKKTFGSLERLETLIAVDVKNFNDSILLTCMEYCPNIKVLDLSGCNKLTGDTLCKIGISWKNLISLKLSRCENLDNSALRAILRNCTNLEVIDTSNCWKITDDLFEISSNETIPMNLSKFGIFRLSISKKKMYTWFRSIQKVIDPRTNKVLDIIDSMEMPTSYFINYLNRDYENLIKNQRPIWIS